MVFFYACLCFALAIFWSEIRMKLKKLPMISLKSRSIKLCLKGLMMIQVISLLFLLLNFSSCTLSFQNISTHGSATDLIDETQDADADISPDLSIPTL